MNIKITGMYSSKMYETIFKPIARQLVFYDFHLKDHVKLNDSGNALETLAKSQSEYVIFTEPLETELIPRHSDIIVGFYCKTDGTLTMEIGGEHVYTRQVSNGEFIYAINDESIIPIICLCFSQIKVFTTAKLDVVGAFLNTKPRKRLGMRGAFAACSSGGKFHLFAGGVYRKVDSVDKSIVELTTELPNMRHIPIVIDDIFSRSLINDTLLPYIQTLNLDSSARSIVDIQDHVRECLTFELGSRFRIHGETCVICTFGFDPTHLSNSEYTLYINLSHSTRAGGGSATFEREIIVPLKGTGILFHSKSKHYFEPLFVTEQPKFGIAFSVRRHIEPTAGYVNSSDHRDCLRTQAAKNGSS